MAEETTLENRTKAIKEVMALYRVERILYNVFTAITIVVLIVVAVLNFVGIKGIGSYTVIALAFAPAGAMGIAIGQFHKLINTTLKFLNQEKIETT